VKATCRPDQIRSSGDAVVAQLLHSLRSGEPGLARDRYIWFAIVTDVGLKDWSA